MRATHRKAPRARRSHLLAVGLCALVHLAALPARAADAGADTQAQAQELIDKAFQEHSAGNDTQAVGTYLKAYGISHAAAILYNVATIYDRHLHEQSLAVEYFRRYIEAPDATPELVQKATARITALKKEMADEDAKRMAQLAAPPPVATQAPAVPPAAPPASETPAPTGWSGLKTAGAVVGSVGLVGLGTSLVLGAVAKGKIDSANKVCTPVSCPTIDSYNDEHSAVSLSTASTVTFVAGAAVLAAGAAMFFLAPSPQPGSSSSARLSVVPQAGPQGGGITVYASF